MLNALRNHTKWILFLVLLFWSMWQMGSGVYIQAKASLAQILLEDAWQKTLQDKQPHKPWEWADTWPVAKLQIGEDKQAMIVLADASGRTLAFGPGLLWPGQWQSDAPLIAIAGHRDTHFSALQSIQLGSQIQLQGKSGVWQDYEVTALNVVDSQKAMLDFSTPGEVGELVLITCYPFEQQEAGGPLRYVVQARAVNHRHLG